MCRALRAEGNDVPIIFLTARDTPEDRVSGFTKGGDAGAPRGRAHPPPRGNGRTISNRTPITWGRRRYLRETFGSPTALPPVWERCVADAYASCRYRPGSP